jgi:hypothetical protein
VAALSHSLFCLRPGKKTIQPSSRTLIFIVTLVPALALSFSRAARDGRRRRRRRSCATRTSPGEGRATRAKDELRTVGSGLHKSDGKYQKEFEANEAAGGQQAEAYKAKGKK